MTRLLIPIRLSPSGQIANMEQGDARRGDSNNGDRGNVNITPTTNNTNNISPQPAADAMVTTAIASTVATTQPAKPKPAGLTLARSCRKVAVGNGGAEEEDDGFVRNLPLETPLQQVRGKKRRGMHNENTYIHTHAHAHIRTRAHTYKKWVCRKHPAGERLNVFQFRFFAAHEQMRSTLIVFIVLVPVSDARHRVLFFLWLSTSTACQTYLCTVGVSASCDESLARLDRTMGFDLSACRS